MSLGPMPSSDPEEYPNPNADLALRDVTMARADVDLDARVISERVFNEIVERAPGWVARDGNLESWLVESFALIAAELRADAMEVPGAIFRTYGEEILGLAARPASRAIGYSTWVARNGLGYEIPTGTQLTLQRTGDDLIAFEVVEGAVIPRVTDDATADLTVEERRVENVLIRALETGEHANGLAGQGWTISPASWVEDIWVDNPTFRGDDGETVEQFTDSLAVLMRAIALRPILPADYALLALRTVGVARAIALDTYRETDENTGATLALADRWHHQRTISLILTDNLGEPCAPEVKDDVRDTLEDLREVNFVVQVIDASYDSIDVSFDVTCFTDEDPEFVHGICVDALTTELSPINWRLGLTSPAMAAGEVIPPPTAPTPEVPNPPYIPPGRQTIRPHDLVGLLDRQRGVDHVTDVLVNGQHVNYDMPLPTTLPRPGTIEGVVREQRM